METLPGSGADVLRKRDLDAFEERINLRFDALGRRFDAFGNRFESLGDTTDPDSPFGQFQAALQAQTELIRGRTRTVIRANVLMVLLVTPVLVAIGKLV